MTTVFQWIKVVGISLSLILLSKLFIYALPRKMINTRLKSFNTRTLKVARNDDEIFHSRHERNKRDIDAIINTFHCKPRSDGSYGDLTNIRVDISYTYEIEVENSVFESSIDQAILAIEKAINESVAQLIFPGCHDQLNRTRRLKAQIQRENVDRYLEVMGIIPSPIDTLDRTEACQAFERLEGSECGLVLGGLSLYLEEGSDMAVIEDSVLEVLTFIEQNFKSDSYISAFQGVKKISYISDYLPTFLENEEEIELIELRDEDLAAAPLSLILIGGIGAVFIFVCIILKGSPKEEIVKFKNTYEVVNLDVFSSDSSSPSKRSFDDLSSIGPSIESGESTNNNEIYEPSIEVFDPITTGQMGLVEFQQTLFTDKFDMRTSASDTETYESISKL